MGGCVTIRNLRAEGDSVRENMQALVYHGKGKVALEERARPSILDPRDATVRVTLASICASDLHIIHGAVPRAREDVVLGHEFVGEVIAVGERVGKIRVGDMVAVNCETFCGECFFCRRGFVNNCVTGGWELGCRIDGGHAEFARIPFADNCLTVIPDGVTDAAALFIGDILSSGFFGAELAEIAPGDTVAVIGSGPVGLCAMMCARLFGPAAVAAIDVDDHRLDLALRHGLADVVFNPLRDDAEAGLRAMTEGRGADAVIEAAGGADTFQTAWKIARPNASVAVVAMYGKPQTLPLEHMYGKNLKFKTGGVDAVHCAELMRLVAAGRLDTTPLISHRGPLNDILAAYRLFGDRGDNCMKWAVTPFER